MRTLAFLAILAMVSLVIGTANSTAACLNAMDISMPSDCYHCVQSELYDACNMEVKWQIWFTRTSKDFGTGTTLLFDATAAGVPFIANYYGSGQYPPGPHYFTGWVTATNKRNHRISINSLMEADCEYFSNLRFRLDYYAGSPRGPEEP